MFTTFAQSDYMELETTTVDPYGTSDAATNGFGGLEGGALLAAAIIGLVLLIVSIAGLWKVFQKAGKPGWAAIVPVYNGWVFFEIAGKPGWWILLSLLGVIPVLGVVASIVVFVLSIFAAIEISKRFGKGTGMTLLQILLPFVAYPILGFGSAKYTVLPGTTPGSVPVPAGTGAAANKAGEGAAEASATSADNRPAAADDADAGSTPEQKPPQPPKLVQ